VELTARDALARTILLTRQQRLPDVDENDLVSALANTTMAIVANEENLSSSAAQATVVALVGLVTACGIRVRLVMPTTAVTGHQPPMIGDDLLDGLCKLAADVVPGVEATVDPNTRAGDIVFVLGSTPWNGEANRAWRLTADAWSGSMLKPESLGAPIPARLPLGGLAAAVAAAGEPYRAALQSLVAGGSRLTDPALLVPAEEVTLRLAPAQTPESGFNMRSLDLVSGGALTSSLMHALLRVEELDLNIRLWEPEDADGTNLNRYVLLRRSMLPISKVDMLRRWLRPGISLTDFQAPVDELRLRQIGQWAPWVFVGADRVEARWLVQSAWPEHLVVAGTVDFLAVVSEHDRTRPCARCLHAAANEARAEVATISFVSYLGGLLAATRLLSWSAVGASPDSQQVTWAYGDRLDSPTGFRPGAVTREAGCPICSRR